MAGTPTQHHTHGKTARRRAHLALKPLNLSACPKCKSAKPAHKYCPNCGFYKGKEVVDVLANLSKKEKKAKAKEIAE